VFTPLHRAKDVKESDYISKIGLMIADEQYVFLWKLLKIFCALDVQFVYDHYSRVGKNAHECVNDFTDEPKIF